MSSEKKTERVHAARLIKYRAQHDGTTVSEELLEQAEHLEANYEIVDELIDIGEASDGIFVQVQWYGLPDKCDWTWNELNQLQQDVPQKLDNFLSTTSKKQLAQKARDVLETHA